MDRWKGEWIEGMDEWINRWTHKKMDGLLEGQVECMDQQMVGWLNEWIKTEE